LVYSSTLKMEAVCSSVSELLTDYTASQKTILVYKIQLSINYSKYALFIRMMTTDDREIIAGRISITHTQPV
jgi:hypothetical protein